MSYQYYDSENYVNRKALAFWRFTLSVLVIVALYFGFIHRFAYMYKYRSYECTSGKVADVDYLKPEDDDDEISFFAIVEYTVNGVVYRTDLDNDSRGDYIPVKGDEVNILYIKENPSEAVVAKKDWLTGALIPMRDKSEVSMLLGLFTLSIWVILDAFAKNKNIPKAFRRSWFIIGLDGLLSGIALRIPAIFFLCLVGAVGIFIGKAVEKQSGSW